MRIFIMYILYKNTHKQYIFWKYLHVYIYINIFYIMYKYILYINITYFS